MAKELFVYSPYKSKFEEQVSSGAVDDSQIGIIAETGELWVKGTYLPIVDLSNKADISKGVIEADGFKDSTDTTFFTPNRGLDPNTTLATQKYVAEATTNFANDLTGVIEATAEEFTYRPSAGDRSIRDASAVIRRIKGNTSVWGQFANITDSLVNSGYIVERSEDRMSFSITRVGSSATSFWCALNINTAYRVLGHKYLFVADAEASNITSDADYVSVTNYNLTTPNHDFKLRGNQRGLYSCISTPSEGSTGWQFAFYAYGNAKLTVHNLQCFDLTSIFGAGNEPSTYEDFKAIYPDIYPYCEPEVRNVITNQITTIGFNQWDERWELGALATNTGDPVAHHERGRSVNFFDVVPNAEYFCATIAPTTTNSSGTVGSIAVFWYDSNQNFIKYADITNKTCVAPSTARYAKICTWGGDVNAIFNSGVNINLSHSKVRNGEYEPYKRNIRLLPEIYKYFPYGMNGNANVWDEINAESAIKRWGVVDLGSLTWSAEETNTSGVYRWASKGISAFPTATVSTIPNIICAKYTTGSNDNTYGRRDCVTITTSGRVRIFDSQYQEISSKEAFVASLQGVLLYYELLEPIETPITEAIQLDYEVDDFGTEKASGFGNSAPFRADIVYQFNAEGRIRDNSRNIERVESTITTRLIPSQSAMLGLPNKVMTWDGNKTLMSLPIAEDIDHWDLEESKLGTIPTSQQVREYISSITDNLTPSQSAMLESSNRVMVWNGDYAMTSLPIAANFAEWADGAIPTGQQVMDYISAIKGSLSSGLMPKETIELLPAWEYHIAGNKVYEMATHPNIDYTIDLKLRTDIGVDITSDNEWRVRIDARNGFSTCALTIKPNTDGYKLRWAYPEASGAGTAPNIKAGFIWDIQFRMIGRTLLGSYKKY